MTDIPAQRATERESLTTETLCDRTSIVCKDHGTKAETYAHGTPDRGTDGRATAVGVALRIPDRG